MGARSSSPKNWGWALTRRTCLNGVLETIDWVPTVFLDLEKLPTLDKDWWGERLKGYPYNTLDIESSWKILHAFVFRPCVCICICMCETACICAQRIKCSDVYYTCSAQSGNLRNLEIALRILRILRLRSNRTIMRDLEIVQLLCAIFRLRKLHMYTIVDTEDG